MYDIAIVGAGPAGIFAALELIKNKPDLKICIYEKGPVIEKRKCPARTGSKCAMCWNCDLLCGWGGAGAFSDGKLTLNTEIGGNLLDYMNRTDLKNMVDYADKIWLDYGATQTVYGADSDAVADIARRATLAELELIYSPIRHLGSDRSTQVLKNMQDFLSDKIDIVANDAVTELIVEENKIKGFKTSKDAVINADHVIVAPGRQGAQWLAAELQKLKIELQNNAVDVGVRVELPAPVMKELSDKLYESKLVYYAPTFGDQVRTFCMNPNGEVVCENNNGIVTVNGHSYAETKTENTNFALLVSKRFTEPFKEPIAYGQHISRLANMLGGGIIVQRFGDLLAGRRSTPEKIMRGVVKPTLTSATPGDLSLVLPYRHMTSIVEMLMALDKIAPGVASRYTLLYGIEVKFYSSRVNISNTLETVGIDNLYTIGDGAGVTRGLIQASVSGVVAARAILGK